MESGPGGESRIFMVAAYQPRSATVRTKTTSGTPMMESLAHYSLIQAIAAWGSGSLVLAALTAWLGAVWGGRIARNEVQAHARALEALKAEFGRTNEDVKSRLGAELQRKVLVDKVRFEHEYATCQALWSAAVELAERTSNLASWLDGDRVDTDGWAEDRRLWSCANDALVDASSRHRPFFSPSVFAGAEQVLQKAQMVHRRCVHAWSRDANSPDGVVEAREQLLASTLDDLDAAIRNRLDEVRVV